ncbi:MAG: hypothetical protein LBE32_00670 [Burkholderiales bacterium]|jgi:hypothetical protein|nr:hypothetical protein [Burkholderiales bacterium]
MKKCFLLIALSFFLASCKTLNVTEVNGKGAVAVEKSAKAEKVLKTQLDKPVLANADFEAQDTGEKGKIKGWQFMQHAGPESYEFALDRDIFYRGTQSLRIKNIGEEPYGLAEQKISATALRGKKVALSAWIKTQETNGRGAGLSMRATRGGAIAAYNFMESELIRGSQDWRRYTISLEIPESATALEIGFMLQGSGIAWIDDVEWAILP